MGAAQGAVAGGSAVTRVPAPRCGSVSLIHLKPEFGRGCGNGLWEPELHPGRLCTHLGPERAGFGKQRHQARASVHCGNCPARARCDPTTRASTLRRVAVKVGTGGDRPVWP
eukprot:3941702-Rhodomonas_salina.4